MTGCCIESSIQWRLLPPSAATEKGVIQSRLAAFLIQQPAVSLSTVDGQTSAGVSLSSAWPPSDNLSPPSHHQGDT